MTRHRWTQRHEGLLHVNLASGFSFYYAVIMISTCASVIPTLFAILPLAALTCPNEAVMEIFVCLSNLTVGLTVNGVTGADSAVIRRHCSTGQFGTSVSCVENLFCACEDTDQIDMLHNMADPRKIKASFAMICQHIDLYTRSSPCIMEQDLIIKMCTNHVERSFNDSIQSARYVSHVIYAWCRYQIDMRNCFVEPVAEACGDDIGSVLFHFVMGIVSPVCQRNSNPSRSPVPQLSLAAILFSLTVSVSSF